MTQGHLEFCWRLSQHVARHIQSQVSVLVVSYSLTPSVAYPVPVEETIWAMKYIFEGLKKDPSRLIVAGDSAGATLALNVIAHATHPHPGIPEYKGLESVRFRGLLLLSAWADFRFDLYPSYKANEASDVAKVETLELWSREYLRSAAPSVWSAPCLAEGSWWHGLKVDGVLLTAGSQECERDVVIQLGRTLQVCRISTSSERS